MSDAKRLQSVLEKLASGQATDGLDTSDEQTTVISLLRAVDEVILPREITLRTDDGELNLLVAKRSILSISGDITADLGEASADELGALGQSILAKLVNKTVSLDVRRPIAPVDPSEVGATTEVLAGAWVSLMSDVGIETDKVFPELVGTSLAHLAWRDGDIVDSKGPHESLPSDDFDPSILRNLSSSSSAGFVAGPANQNASIVYKQIGDEEILAVVADQNVDAWLNQ